MTGIFIATLILAGSPAIAVAAQTVWLDSLDLTSMEQGWGAPQTNRSITRKPLSLNGKIFERGVGTHSPGTYHLQLEGGTRRFEATVGLDDSAGGAGSVVFQIVADGKKIYDSGVMLPGAPAKPVSVDLRGVKSLLLAVTDAGDGYHFDHADWADARFTVTGKKPMPIPGPGEADPIAALKTTGRSAARLATPVRLPLERTLPGPITDWVLMEVDGRGHKEYYLRYTKLSAGGCRYAQRRGRASNGLKPMWVLANERTGNGLALMLAYMGNWTFEVQPQGKGIVVKLATSPADLAPFKEINGMPVPGALVSEFTGHWDYGTQPMVRFTREKLLRDPGPTWPPVQYNTWYDLYDKLTEQRLVEAARAARDVGCELFTIDAGWFGQGLDAQWSLSLGDWEVNRDRLPNGMAPIAAAVHALGMKFGLWFEIECAAPSSKVAEAHPDWFLTDTKGSRLSKRSMLDFGNPQVLEHAKKVLDDAIKNYSLDYVKMDFNTDPAIENEHLSAARDPLYRHYRGMAELWSYLRTEHPKLIVEDCSSGARRHELTSAALTDTHWISDTVANQPNLLIMFGATFFFPASTCSHWTTKPDQQEQVLDLDAQFVINMMGHMGLSGAITSWDEKTLGIVNDRIAQYKRLRPLIGKADVFHLTTPRLGAVQAALYRDPATDRGLLFAFQAGDPKLDHSIALRGLDRSSSYRLSVPVGPHGMVPEGRQFSGRMLTKRGLQIRFPGKGAAVLVEIEPVQNGKPSRQR